jgi:hypothetical protein
MWLVLSYCAGESHLGGYMEEYLEEKTSSSKNVAF